MYRPACRMSQTGVTRRRLAPAGLHERAVVPGLLRIGVRGGLVVAICDRDSPSSSPAAPVAVLGRVTYEVSHLGMLGLHVDRQIVLPQHLAGRRPDRPDHHLPQGLPHWLFHPQPARDLQHVGRLEWPR